MRARFRSTAPRWPFWLLLAAWFCANSPQAATYALLGWVAEARSFSHQQRLTTEVAFLLGGEKAAARETAVAATAHSVPEKTPPLIPTEAVLKKLPLYAAEGLAEVWPPAERAQIFRAVGLAWSGAGRAPPLPEPPRDVAV